MALNPGMARVRACLVVLLFSCVGIAHADTGHRNAYWAGFAFTGDASVLSDAVPHATAAVDAIGTESLNATLLGALRRQAPAHLTLIEDDLAKLDGSTSAVVLAAALDRELVSVEEIGGRHKVLVELGLQALFFDFRERQVVASYPLTLQHIDLMETPPDASDIEAIVGALLHGPATTDLPQVLAGTIADARLPHAAARRLQVGAVALSDKAREKLPDAAMQSTLEATLAHELTKILSASTGLGLLPPATGQAIGGAMAARFADNRVYQLTIPEADYVVQLQVDDWRSGVIKQTAAMTQMLFGAFFTIRVVEPYSGTQYFSQPLRKGATKVVPASQERVDYWSASYDTLLAGFHSFAQAAADRPGHRDWLGEQKPGGRALQQHTKALQELIQSCR